MTMTSSEEQTVPRKAYAARHKRATSCQPGQQELHPVSQVSTFAPEADCKTHALHAAAAGVPSDSDAIPVEAWRTLLRELPRACRYLPPPVGAAANAHWPWHTP